ncbi:MAG: hypothetical protein QM486_11565 [Flavobacteriaceae bacterium]
MKNLLLIIVILLTVSAQSQSLNDVFKKYLQPRSTAEQLRIGFKKVEDLCATTPEEKCNKAKASALFLLSNKYYAAVYQLYSVDKELAVPILEKANELYNKANSYMPITEFTTSQKRMMLGYKIRFEAD